MNMLQILFTSHVRCSHFTLRNLKKYLLFISDYLRYLRRKQIVTVVLQRWLFTYCCSVLPIICIALVLRLGHTTGGACVLMWTLLRLEAAACCDMD